MNPVKIKFVFLFLLASVSNYAQLGFCPGSKGDPIFSENFGNGTTYGPALPAGTTTYPFVTGAPNDGQYTLFYHSNLYTTWHYSLDHTPDTTNGANGKMLLMNANAVTSGDFYRKTVSGLCVNTTFEFSAWLMNVYNPNTNYCGAGQIPINVRFEIWNADESVLLVSGNTGNIIGTPAPVWQQFALVFTTVNETSVILKMKNNGVGGCGNDLAIDDIAFSACGDLTTVTSPSAVGSTYSTCDSPASVQLNASTLGGVPYFYQWQSSPDGISWTDITGAVNSAYMANNLTSLTYFRAKAAQDIANLNNSFCSTLSNVFTVSLLPMPNVPTNDGDRIICSNEPIPSLSVTSDVGTDVNWYDALTGGTLLLANSSSFTPTSAGIYYAETYNILSSCISTTRTPVELSVVPLPDVTISGTTTICSGNSAIVNFSGTPNAIVIYKINGGSDQTITLNSTGSASITVNGLTATTTYTLVSCTSAVLNSCTRMLSAAITITVNNVLAASFSSNSPVCEGTSATLYFIGTPGATVTYGTTGFSNQTIVLDSTGNASVATPDVSVPTIYSLIDVSLGGGTGCMQTLSQSITIATNALPTASINVSSATICTGQTTTLNFTGTPAAIITYTLNGGTDQEVTLDSSGSVSVITPALSVNTTYQLVSIVLPSTGCSQLISGSVVVSILPTPVASYSGNLTYCEDQTIAINLSSTLIGTTFNWTVTENGTSGAIAGSGDQITAVILLTGNSSGTVVYMVTPVLNGCSGSAIPITITILPTPLPQIIDGVICTTGSGLGLNQPYTLDTNLDVSNHSFQWFFAGYQIPGAFGSTYEANQTGVYSVIATNSAGCISDPVDAVVSERPQGESLIIEQSATFSDNPTVTVSVVGGAGPFSYQLDENSFFQSSNVFQSVLPGNHTITVIDEYCTYLTGYVTIIDYPKFFTPNGDGFHDTWNISGLDNAVVRIFDRYGKLLKQISTEGLGWDGSYNGHLLPSSDYWFSIDYLENGAPKFFRAHFAMKR